VSAYSTQYLNENMFVGYVAERGPAWWAENGQAKHQYEMDVPEKDVRELLWPWTAKKSTTMVETDSGEFMPLRDYRGKTRNALVRSDNGMMLGIMGEGYPDHGYNERLLDNLTAILDGEVKIGSAGLLKGGAVGFVQMETPDTVVSAATGEKYRPFITGMSSFDGSLATGFKAGCTRIVCDNTFASFRSESGAQVKFKNTANSAIKIATAREALDILFETSTEFDQQVSKLLAQEVTAAQFDKILNLYIPVPEEKGKGQTQAINSHDSIRMLYDTDERVAPWSGTEWGTLQAFNTYEQHLTSLRGSMERLERNTLNFLKGDRETADNQILAIIGGVLQDA